MLTGNKTRVEFIESYIKHGAGDYEWSDNHGELIRCKDCKYYDSDTQSCLNGLDGIFTPEWFCADGER